MKIFTYIKSHRFVSSVLAIVVIVISIIAGRMATSKTAIESTSDTKKVTLTDVSAFRKDNTNISVDGIVESSSQADLRSQMSAPVSVINLSIGDPVYAGQIILELQNNDVRAHLSQAMASLALAKGQQNTGSASLSATKQAAIDKVRDAYIKCYDTINTQVDNILYNNDGNGGRLQSYVLDNRVNSEITDIDIEMKSNLRTWKTMNDSLSVTSDSESIENAITVSQKYLSKTDILLGDMLQTMNDSARYATPSLTISLNTWKAITTGARATLSGAAQALTAANMSLSTSNISQGSTVEAQVALAEAGVNNLQAQLAKTIIRSPINGKVASLPLRVGELATPGTLLASVVGNEQGLKIKAYASGEDLSSIKTGSKALIRNIVKGIVTNVAPSVNSINRKAEVDISIIDSNISGLVIGQSASVMIINENSDTNNNQASSTDKSIIYTLPIQDVKIIPGSAYVYTVDENSKIKKNEVMLGEVRGDFIEVISGLSAGMEIVTPVYELDEGESVTVQ